MTQLLPYDINAPQIRTPQEEWRPHAKQASNSIEWWYLTSLFADASGNQYFLMWCLFNFTGEDYFGGAPVPPDHRVATLVAGFTDYSRGQHVGAPSTGVLRGEDMWDSEHNQLQLLTEDSATCWSYHGDELTLELSVPEFSGSFQLQGAEQVMWAKDHLGIEGFIQEGDEKERSFYYSLPRLALNGTFAFEDADGKRREVEVQGHAWIDRQWGDFNTMSWEWTSMRFDSGARLNLYNFWNGYQTATYQTPDGQTQWFDHFVVEQNGYVKAPSNGIWMSWGWTYEFPIDIEGRRRLRVEPYSREDVYASDQNTLFEGPSRIYDDATGEQLGVAVTESMDVRVMNNSPYGPNQH